MSNEHIEILKEFQSESKTLNDKLIEILEKCEGDFTQVKSLEEYGNTVDRVMGGAKSLAMQIAQPGSLTARLGDYAAICKAVGYKASQIKDNEHFYDVCVAFLLDATETQAVIIDHLLDSNADFKSMISDTFLERLRWISSQFGADYRATVDIHKGKAQKLNQNDIDQLLKKLGLD